MNKSPFWSFIEELEDFSAPLADWKNTQHGKHDIDAFRHAFLSSTNQYAKIMRCPAKCDRPCPMRVLYKEKCIEAVCCENLSCSHSLNEHDILIYQLSINKLHRVIAEAFGFELAAQSLNSKRRYLLGTYTAYAGDQIVIDVKTNGMKSLAKEFQTDGSVESLDSEPEIVRLSVPMRITSRDNRRIVILPDDSGEPAPIYPVNLTLVQALAKAHTWFEILERGEAGSILQLADMLNQDRTYVGRMLNLVNLSPKIQTAILKGEEPAGLTLKKLRNDLPVDWQEQRELFGWV